MKPFEHLISQDSDYYVYTPSHTARELFFYPIYIGHYCYQPGYSLSRTSYDSFLLLLVTQGSLTISCQGTTFTASSGTAVLINCYQPHQYAAPLGCTAFWMHFDGPLASGYYEYLVKKNGSSLFLHNFSAILQELEELYLLFRNAAPVHESSVSARISNILGKLDAEKLQENTTSGVSSLTDTIAYINEHLTEPLCLKDLAKRASLSPFYFTRLFARETGMTPHQYLIASRISASKFLLKSTDLKIRDIALQCGFQNESSFCSTFKKWEHTTPTSYRNTF